MSFKCLKHDFWASADIKAFGHIHIGLLLIGLVFFTPRVLCLVLNFQATIFICGLEFACIDRNNNYYSTLIRRDHTYLHGQVDYSYLHE